jgi:cytochrome c
MLPRLLLAAALGVGATIAGPACAQSAAQSAAPDGAALFKQQCSACHALDPNAPPHQGPLLLGVYGRKAGTVPGFHYSEGFANADFAWDDAHLNAYLTNPQSVIPGAIMPYRQAKAPVRQAIIAYLKEQSAP